MLTTTEHHPSQRCHKTAGNGGPNEKMREFKKHISQVTTMSGIRDLCAQQAHPHINRPLTRRY